MTTQPAFIVEQPTQEQPHRVIVRGAKPGKCAVDFVDAANHWKRIEFEVGEFRWQG